jgi:acetyltransferase-like isoleucine patch superfamily enzyme
MIRLGQILNSLYETTKSNFVWELRGTCCFKGTCVIGHNSAISTGKNAYLEFGTNFSATTSLKIACYKSVKFGENTRVAWDVLVIDTDFHETVNVETGERSIPSKDIIIGKNNWIGIHCLILKGTITPDFCVVGASSLLNRKYDFPKYSLIAGNPPLLHKTGIYRDLNSYVE